MAHLALAVRDEERSRSFYETYFGFGATPAERMSDGVLMLYDADDFALALKETDEPISLPGFLHFGFRGAASPAEVRAHAERLRADGVPIVEEGGAGLRERQVPRPRRLRHRARLVA